MRKNPLVFAFAIGLAISINASGYRPSGWTYGAWPYVYDAPSQSWYYMNESDTQWCVEMFTGQWRTLGFSPLAAGWTYWQWPYAFDWDSGSWFYLNESDVQWCCNLSPGTWSRLGVAEAANADIVGTWTITSSIDNDHPGGIVFSSGGNWSVPGDTTAGGSYTYSSGTGTMTGQDGAGSSFSASITVSGNSITIMSPQGWWMQGQRAS
jgi:hypothetical protein